MSLEDHLRSRDCIPSNYSMVIDEENEVATFLLYNLSGQLVGYQQYRPGRPKNTSGGRQYNFDPRDLRYFTKLARNSTAVFGLDTLNSKDRKLFLVEGIFDACSIHSLGYNAIAVLCNNPKHLRSFLRTLGYKLIAVCDGGEAGNYLASIADKSIQCPVGTDPNSLTKEELLQLITT